MDIYTGWGKDGVSTCLIKGEGPPRFANGTVMEDVPELIYVIEAESWEEASLEHHRRLDGKTIRIALSYEDFKSLVSRGVVRQAGVEIILSDIGFAFMERAIEEAKRI
jgi:hypothetical protein